MMPKDRMKAMAEGIFFSLLTYGIQDYDGVWGLDILNFTESRTKSFTREDNHNIQVILNKVLRSLTDLLKETPVRILLDKSGYLSVQQFTVYHTLVTMFKEPVYSYTKYKNF